MSKLTLWRIEQIENAMIRSKRNWIDQVDRLMTKEEIAEVIAHEKTITTGDTCFITAMFDLKVKLNRE